jgi:tetratricopeptide (TPR) repeat protein
MVGGFWQQRLVEALARPKGDHWLARYHLGIMACAAGDDDGAAEQWRTSLRLEPSAWAYCCLGLLEKRRGNAKAAIDLLMAAHSLASNELPIALELLDALLAAERHEEACKFIESLHRDLMAQPRVGMVRIRTLLELGRLAEAEECLREARVPPDLREGDQNLTELWFELQARRASLREGVPLDDSLRQRVRAQASPPRHIDFRMRA